MSRLANIHNKTQVVETEELPFNPHNRLLQEVDLRKIFDDNGLKDVQFNNINLYRTAFVHKSYCTMKNADFEKGNLRKPDGVLPLQDMSYERLEFLGDSILELIVSQYLYEMFPDQDEGFLSKIRVKLVNGKMLGHLGSLIGLEPFLIISKQIEESEGRKSHKILEDVFEAFIAALYLDFKDCDVTFDKKIRSTIEKIGYCSGAGYSLAEAWVIGVIEKHIDMSELIMAKTNYKETLGKYMQNRFQDIPRFFELAVNSRSNQKLFTVSVKDRDGTTIGVGKGGSKKEAENEGAKAALKRYGEEV